MFYLTYINHCGSEKHTYLEINRVIFGKHFALTVTGWLRDSVEPLNVNPSASAILGFVKTFDNLLPGRSLQNIPHFTLLNVNRL